MSNQADNSPSETIDFCNKKSINAAADAADRELKRLRDWLESGNLAPEVAEEFHYRCKHLMQLESTLRNLAAWVD